MNTNKKTNWKREVNLLEDKFVSDLRPGDLVIPIMGPTGAGKSTFINTLFGENVADVGHDLQSQTQKIQHYIFSYEYRRIIILDTPGFDDTNVDDREILRRISVWLAYTYDVDMKLAGLIYLHEITQARMLGTAKKNFDMFDKLCGPAAAENISLITTKWSDVKDGLGPQREDQLRKEHWKELLLRGSRMHRFNYTQASAQNIIEELLTQKIVDAVQIQSELVLEDRTLAETNAGRTLRYTLQELLEAQKKVAKQLQDSDETGEKTIENAKKIQSLIKQIELLSIPIYAKLKRFLGFVRTSSLRLKVIKELTSLCSDSAEENSVAG